MNWNVVSNGGMTVAALALADVPRYASVAKEALKFAREGIPLALSGYGPKGDGAWQVTPQNKQTSKKRYHTTGI